jgi:hypothetical protein
MNDTCTLNCKYTGDVLMVGYGELPSYYSNPE